MPRGAVVRMLAVGAFCAMALYLVLFWEPPVEIREQDLAPEQPTLVSVPRLDSTILAKAKDATREDRLFLETEPLIHLLAQALNVSPDAARALGMPEEMPQLAALRTNIGEWRGRWIWLQGKVERIEGPKPGHPVPGYGIYEATLRLADGNFVLFAFSKPPEGGIEVGQWARTEGYVLKLRDVPYPIEMKQAPMLVGAQLQKDYETWAPVKKIDPTALSGIGDVTKQGEQFEITEVSWRTIDEDQSSPLWHLGAYVRDMEELTLQQWRTVPAFSSREVWESFRRNEVAPGTPMRLLGTLAAQRTISAKPNPAGIREWTEAWVQIPDMGGKTVPVWLPKGQKGVLGGSMEIRAHYFRRYSYETRSGKQIWTPLFVANSLDPFVFETGQGMREISLWATGGVVLLAFGAIWGARRERQRSAAQEDALIQRRRKRRESLSAATASRADGLP